MSKILITGDRGFIAGYLIPKLLANGHEVIGIDNDWKYGPQVKDFDTHGNYTHLHHDAKDTDFLKEIMSQYDIEYFVPFAAIIGGISLFHELAYDLLSENEKLTAAAFDSAIWAHKNMKLKKIVAISSSMVFESTKHFPTPESALKDTPAPFSTYGFQKLSVEYFCKGAWEQYHLPYTIARPFNCVGVGEKRALMDKKVKSGNIELTMSHVVPDLVKKIYLDQTPLEIFGSGNQIRHYTHGSDLAEGIYRCIFHKRSLNQDFNLSTRESTTVMQLVAMISSKMGKKITTINHAAPFPYDVQMRVPETSKALEYLDFAAEMSLSEILDDTIPWICRMIDEDKV